MTNLPIKNAPQLDYILIDASGSMYPKWNECLVAIDAYVEQLKLLKTPTRVTLASFSTEGGRDQFAYDKSREGHDPQDWVPALHEQPYMFGGSTPLADAINEMMSELRDLNPGMCSITIATDGDENCSQTTMEQARGLLDWARRRGWQVNFIGCDFNNSYQAKLLGASDDTSLSTSSRRLADATRDLAKKRHNNVVYGAPMSWSEDERKRFGGYLGH